MAKHGNSFMKKLIVIIFFSLLSSVVAQSNSSNLYLSSVFNSNIDDYVNFSLGARGYYDGLNGADSYFNSSVSINPDISFGAEINYQSGIFDSERMNIFIAGSYNISKAFSIGGFSNFETKKYGIVTSVRFSISDFQFDTKGIIDIKYEDFICSLSMRKNLSEDFDLMGEFLISEGNIQSSRGKSLILFSTGIKYQIADYVSIFGNFGVNLKDQYKDNDVDLENILVFGLSIHL